MSTDDLPDVPAPGHHNFQDISEARAWAEKAMLKRPWREDFFQIFIRELLAAGARTVLEVGSGPGFLAQRILEALPQIEYTALDFSAAMHTLARERLGGLAARVRFVEANFKQSGWETGLPIFDAVVCMQAAHEVRHKLRIPALYTAIRKLVRNGGTFLVCDILPDPETTSEAHMTVEEQEAALRQVGFSNIALLLEKGGLAMFRAQNG